MNRNVLTYLPGQNHETEAPQGALGIAVVTGMQNSLPESVMLNELSYSVVGYLSLVQGIVPGVRIGDKVLVSTVQDGVLIHGVVTPIDTPARASFGFVEDKLVIEAQGAVVLKSGNSTVELTETGGIRIDGKNVRTVAKKTLTLLGAHVNLN